MEEEGGGGFVYRGEASRGCEKANVKEKEAEAVGDGVWRLLDFLLVGFIPRRSDDRGGSWG